MGEENTIDSLKWAKRRGLIWGWVDGLAIEGGDIDHIVVTKRGGVVAIDSKWHYTLWDDTLQRADTAAQRSARRARLILISLHRRMEVTPLAVIWGGAQQEFETVDVPRHVIPGGQLSTWLRSLQGEVLG